MDVRTDRWKENSIKKDSLKYSREHLWVYEEGNTAWIGLSAHALKMLGTVVFLNLPETGERYARGDAFGDIESVKTVSDLIAPADMEILSVNDALAEDAGLLDGNLEQSWLAQVEFQSQLEGLMDEAAYVQYANQL